MKKLISATIAGTLLTTGVGSTLNNPIAKAENIQKNTDVSQEVKGDKQYQALSPKSKDSFKVIVKNNNYNNQQQMQLLRETGEIKGISKNGTSNRGKIGITKAVIKQAWKTLPPNIKKKIGTQSKFYGAVKTFDHFTDDIENDIYKRMKGLGLTNNEAWIATKAITLIIL
ncbi:hypothetical protein BU036_12545 [Staphylococcus simulans]|uniref:hypothetical protein n=3 Tax=Staphylococcus simulans TaxID=1286 RepID=UPI000D03B40B|nr:hypothetical protein [Staphylococcus simulans]PTI85354.1 hypothetical protein BU053_11180 [Staphylococcus simulans]PTI95789.1 hypothetical protein BU054_13025 [Staphylococcus simulans]PTJ14284.1 hypothetical protein BU038_10710 [Staphylococcus simulans]PTJ21497.1 hypothetical protein BU039_11785 [Staphylococcus simulans]PTJ28690.1 hypothetical protein BU025_10690 [Staphylococcus simulans]